MHACTQWHRTHGSAAANKHSHVGPTATHLGSRQLARPLRTLGLDLGDLEEGLFADGTLDAPRLGLWPGVFLVAGQVPPHPLRRHVRHGDVVARRLRVLRQPHEPGDVDGVVWKLNALRHRLLERCGLALRVAVHVALGLEEQVQPCHLGEHGMTGGWLPTAGRHDWNDTTCPHSHRLVMY